MTVYRLNEIACHQLDQLEETYPIICAPTEQVIELYHKVIVLLWIRLLKICDTYY